MAPEAAGLTWWKDVLDSGAVSSRSALLQFSEGSENTAQLIGSMQGGIAYLPFHG